MRSLKTVESLSGCPSVAGSVLWILSVQYYIVQVVAALAWTNSYSLSRNTISDLGNTACGLYGQKFVCSPLHSLMNISFVALGISMALGSLLIYRKLRQKNWGLFIGFGGLAVGGLGTILVGLFPENTGAGLHILGASLPFLIGNAGLVALGLSLKPLPKVLRLYTFMSGFIPLLVLPFFVNSRYLGLGVGGLERIVAYPQSIWLIIFGSYLLCQLNHPKYRQPDAD